MRRLGALVVVALAAALSGATAAHAAPRMTDARLALPVPTGVELAASAAATPAAPRLNPFSGHGTGMALSALAPGLGQIHEGHRTRGWVFLGIDGALWSTLVVSEVESHLRTRTYREVAETFALVAPGTHSATFYRDVGSYSSSEIYNIYLRREARSVFESQTNHPDSAREAFIDGYVRDRGYFGADSWEWDTYEHFVRYTDARRGQHNAARRASLAIGGLVVNRLFAILDLTRTRRSADGAALDGGETASGLAVTTAPDGRMTCAYHTRF